MSASFHRCVQPIWIEILENYDSISELLADDFFAEFQRGVEMASDPGFRRT